MMLHNYLDTFVRRGKHHFLVVMIQVRTILLFLASGTVPMARAWSLLTQTSLRRNGAATTWMHQLGKRRSSSNCGVSISSSLDRLFLTRTIRSNGSPHRTVRRMAGINGDFKMRTTTTLSPVPNHAHRIVLMRHGESAFNNANSKIDDDRRKKCSGCCCCSFCLRRLTLTFLSYIFL